MRYLRKGVSNALIDCTEFQAHKYVTVETAETYEWLLRGTTGNQDTIVVTIDDVLVQVGQVLDFAKDGLNVFVVAIEGENFEHSKLLILMCVRICDSREHIVNLICDSGQGLEIF